MSLFDALTSPPSEITAGEIVSWSEELADYPGATYSVAYKFYGQTPQDGLQQFGIAGVETSTATYTFTTLSTYKPGAYNWQKQITRTSDGVMRIDPNRGTIIIRPNLAAVGTTTFAAAQVAILKTAIAALGASTEKSVSFNGQSFTRDDLRSYTSDLAYWESRVLIEQQKIDRLNETPTGRGIGIRFLKV